MFPLRQTRELLKGGLEVEDGKDLESQLLERPEQEIVGLGCNAFSEKKNQSTSSGWCKQGTVRDGYHSQGQTTAMSQCLN